MNLNASQEGSEAYRPRH